MLFRAPRATEVSAEISVTAGRRAAPVLTLAVAALLALPAISFADAGTTPAPSKGAKATTGAAWQTVSESACKPLADADLAKLPAGWKPYASAARRCDLAAPGATSKVALVSVFADEFYRGRPADAAWEDFPKPLLVDAEFKCVGGLRELFPVDQPRTLTVRYGLWRNGVPQEIRVKVANPAVGGDYALPTLRWDDAHHRYRATGASTSDDSPCPKS